MLDTIVTSCYSNICSVGTATYVAAVTTPSVVAEYLKTATCGKGFTFDSVSNSCFRNKSDWPISVVSVDANSGNFIACSTGYTLFKSTSLSLCIPAIANCKTHTFTNNLVSCSLCAIDANGMPYQLVNSPNGKLCVAAQDFLDNCLTYNSSGQGCLVC